MYNQIHNFLAIVNAAVRGKVMKLKNPDWNKLLSYAVSHKIEPLIYEGCSKYKVFHEAPAEIKNKYLAAALIKITGQIHKTRFFTDIYDKLRSAGLKPLLLKGYICRSLYGELADHRPSVDEDIYIKPEEFPLYRDILEKNGFVMEELTITEELLTAKSHIVFIHKKGLIIELHFNLMSKTNPLNNKINSCFEDAFKSCISQDIDGQLIYTMNHSMSYLYLFLHIYKHFIFYGIGIRQILDLLLYGEKYSSEIDWVTVEKTIRDLSADKLYADILIIGSIYFDFNVETSFIGNDYNLLLRDIMNAGAFGKATEERRLGGNITNSAIRWGRLRYRDLLLPDRALIRQKYKLTGLSRRQLLSLRLKRICKFIKYDLNIITIVKSLKLGRSRIRLLKNYGIIEH